MIRTSLLAAAILAASPALAFISWNDHVVNPLPGQGNFEVIGQAGSGPREYWCAAAQYARQVLGAPANARIAVLRGAGRAETRAGARGVAFTLGGAEGRRPGQGGNFSLSVTEPGFNIATAHGVQLCDTLDPHRPTWLP